MNSRSSGDRLEEFFNGKGFYIVLFLCAAVIGVSAWMMAAGEGTMQSEVSAMKQEDTERIETVVIPPMQRGEGSPVLMPAPEETSEPTAAESAPVEQTAPVWNESETAVWVWPIRGEIERPYTVQALRYDVTMRDWRTHDGVDIAAPLGATVCAAHEGMVASVSRDDLLGTVVTVDHGDGTAALYANLADVPAAKAGDWVEAGAVLGSVGTSALGEIGQGTHLHFAMTAEGESVDPTGYLPG